MSLLPGVPHVLVLVIVDQRVGSGGRRRGRMEVKPRFVLVSSEASSTSVLSIALSTDVNLGPIQKLS